LIVDIEVLVAVKQTENYDLKSSKM